LKENLMPIYETGGYRVKRSAVPTVKKAIREFVAYVKAHEPGTQMYLAWQEKGDATRFLHFFIFKDAAARARHGKSEAVKKFEAVYGPALVGGDVVFIEYKAVSNKR
jgi:quinol monooxygenase YgiN